MITLARVAAFAVVWAAFGFPEQDQVKPDQCIEHLDEFRKLPGLAKPHMTGMGLITHDRAGILRRYKTTWEFVNRPECRRVLVFLPADTTNRRAALEFIMMAEFMQDVEEDLK